MSEAQLGLLGWGPDGGPKLAPGIPPPLPAPRPAPLPRVDPEGFDFVDVVYRGPIIGWQRARTGKGPVAVFHTAPKHKEALASWKGLLQRGWTPGVPPLDFSLQLLMLIRYPVPGFWSRKRRADALARRTRPSIRPDVDNVLKLIGDAGNKVIWKDDSQIASVALERVYVADPEPSIWLRVRRAPMNLFWEDT